MENGKAPATKTRKPYTEPKVISVPLLPEETVLGGCKVTGSSGPLLSNCGHPGAPCGAILAS